jgi:soluble lytic murein transglycosylase-like protein
MNTILIMFIAATTTYQLPPGLLSSLCFVESRHKVEAIHHDDGGSDSVGICQVKLKTAKWLGFKGTEKELMNPEVNIKYAAIYLGRQIKRYGGDTRKGVAAYNTGSFKPGISKYAANQTYVNRVFTAWATVK